MLSRNFGEVYKRGLEKMSVLYNRIEALCKDLGVSITTMCKESGASRASLSDLKVGRKQTLSASTLDKIADYFDTTVDYLMGRTDDSENSDRFGLAPPELWSSGEEEAKKPTADGSELDKQLEGIDFALYGEVKELTDAQKRDVLRFIQFLKQEE